MSNFIQGYRSAAAATLLLAVAACSKSNDVGGEGGLLRYVPADSPYAFVTQDQLPDALYDRIEPQLDELLGGYRRLIRAAVAEARNEVEAEGTDLASVEIAEAIAAELDDLLSVEGLASAGIDRTSRIAVFGQGLLPVIRVTLTDGNLLEKQIADLEARAGKSLETATVDQQQYRYVGDDEWRLLLAIIANELVVAAVPDRLEEAELRKVLGLSFPDESMADSGELTAYSEKYGFEDFLVGFLDVERIVRSFTRAPGPINSAVFAETGNAFADLDEVCRSEVESMAAIMPRVVTGYTDISESELSSRVIMELRSDLAKGVATFVGNVPGLGVTTGDLLSLGMSFDLTAIREFYAARLDAMEAKPLECELFAELQQSVAEGRALLDQPIPPIAYSFKGFLAVVDRIEGMDLVNGIPPTEVDLRLLLATDNAEGLLAMGSMFSPDIAALALQSDGEPVRLNLPQLVLTGQDAFVAMSESGLALSVGHGMENGLKDMLSASEANPAPFSSFDMDADRYYDFIVAGMQSDPDDELADSPELQAAMQQLANAPRDLFSRFRVDVLLTDNGVEFVSDITLKD